METEALAIKCALKHFSPFIQESKWETKVLTDSKPCVEAVNEMNVSLYHISGKDNNISDFISRNPIECTNENCQVCKFLSVESEIAVKSLNTEI